METAGLLLALIVLLFSLYSLTRDDFILLRKNISMDQIFNISLLAIIVGFFSARFLFVAAHFNPEYLSPLVFLALPYFPGVSIIGGVIGAVLFLLYYTARKKIHTERLFDFFTTSLLFSLSFGYSIRDIVLLLQKKHIQWPELAVVGILIVLSFFYLFLFIPKHKRGEMKDGHIGLIFLLCFSVCIFMLDTLSKAQKLFHFIGVEGVVSLLVFFGVPSISLKTRKTRYKVY